MTTQRIVDLSLPIMDGGGFGKPAKMSYYDHEQRGKALAETMGFDAREIDNKANAMEEFSFLTTHTATHFDAPYHYTKSTQGKPALTIDRVPLESCFGPGVWLDFSHKDAGSDISAEDMEGAVNTIQYSIQPADIVLIHTGASASYGKKSCDNMNPGVTREATLWLADQGVKLVGIDACCWDRPPELQLESVRQGERQGKYMQGHRAAGERGICILEWLTNLDQLPHYGFTMYAFPVKVERAGGSWVRAVAMFEES